MIDADAAGHGWFLDPTPALDEEFDSAGDSSMTQMDLLTAIMHEMGHVLGFDHGEAGLMFEALASGRRQSAL